MYRGIIKLKTSGWISNYNLTEQIRKIVRDSKVNEGICNIFVSGTTCGIIINENDMLLEKDFERFFKRNFPSDKIYQHSSNAFSHLSGMLTKNDTTIPVSGKQLILGEWQSIMLWEFDNKERNRDIIVTVMGE